MPKAPAYVDAPSALQRYARRFDATELNSSFHGHHRPTTYARWAASVPADFRFALKLPRAITHDARLAPGPTRPVLERFLVEVGELGAAAGPLLVQLPPSLAFDARVADTFFDELRGRWSGAIACEPRHPTWFELEANDLLVRHQVARVAADPASVPEASQPGGWAGFAYVRLHGSPRTYYSSYEPAYLADLAERLRGLAVGDAEQVWCVFDNTAAGAALDNALELQALLR